MKIVMTLLVRDEEDILETNLDYHLAQGVDHFVVTDNKSEDRTPQILADYVKRGLVDVIEERADNYQQAEWVTRMARLAYTKHGADWVINADADEFFWPLSGNLKTLLGTVPDECGLITVPRLNFLPWNGENDLPFYERMLIRDVISPDDVPEHHPRLQPKVIHRGLAEVEVAQGNHQVLAPPLKSLGAREPIVIFHFPLRSYEQFERKIHNGGRAYEQSSLPASYGAHWRKQYESLKRGELPALYQEQCLSGEEAERRIDAGTVVLDRRLSSFLSRIDRIPAAPPALNVIGEGDSFGRPAESPLPTSAAPAVIVALASELAERPEMLPALAAQFVSEERLNIVIYAPAIPAEEAASLIGPLLQKAGFPEQGGPDLQLLAVAAGSEQRIAEQADALYSESAPANALRALPRFGSNQVGALQALLFGETARRRSR